MSPDVNELDRLAEAMRVDLPGQDEKDAMLAAILATPRQPAAEDDATASPDAAADVIPIRRQGRAGKRALTGIAIAAAAAAIFVLMPGGVSQPVDATAAGVLLRASQAVAAGPPLSPGQRLYTKVTAYQVDSHVLYQSPTGNEYSHGLITSQSVRELWIAPDSSYVVRDRNLQPSFSDPRDKALSDKQDAALGNQWKPVSVDRVDPVAEARDQGRWCVPFPQCVPDPADRQILVKAGLVPTDPQQLRDQLENDSGGVPDGMWSRLHDLLDNPALSAPARAAAYEVAAGIPGARYEGDVTDQLGRRGVQIAYSQRGLDEVMIFDPDTGTLLQSETRLGQDLPAGTPASMTGAAIYRAVYESTATVSGDGVRPDGSKVSVKEFSGVYVVE